ncbi:MAG: hypothetical protein HY611_06895, partial [Elusimicrobia bacterium]|nr:hypothetical protein [Elusimicrobiota bacterium]
FEVSADSGFGAPASSGTQLALTAAVGGLLPGTTYYARVRSHNRDGSVNAYTPAISTTTLLPSVTNVHFISVSSDSIAVSWELDAPENEAPTMVLSTVSDFTTVVSSATGALGQETTTYTQADSVCPNTAYYFKVKVATESDANYSPAISTATRAANPADLAFSGVALTSFTFSWSDNGNPPQRSTYTFEISTDSGFGSLAQSGSQLSLSVLAASLTPNTTHFARARSRNLDGSFNAYAAAVSTQTLADVEPPALAFSALSDGETVSRPRTVAASITDNVSVSSAEFRVNGVFVSSASGPPYQFYWNTLSYADGAYALKALAWDSSGNQGEKTANVNLSYSPPPVPAISSPSNGYVTETSTINVSGGAEPGTTVSLFINDVFASTAAVEPNSSFSFYGATLPLEGSNFLTASAADSRGASGRSSPTEVILDTLPPGAPQDLLASSLSGGRIDLSWSAPASEIPAYYRIYRDVVEGNLNPGEAGPAGLLLVGSLNQTFYTDFPVEDGLYIYAVAAVDSAGNENGLSNIAPGIADRLPPSATIQFTAQAPPLGPGEHPIQIEISEVLAATPILAFTPSGQNPRAVSVLAETSELWTGTVTVTASMNPGTAVFTFQGEDLTGNVSTSVTSGGSFVLDTRGPVGTVVVSTQLAKAGNINLTINLDEPAVSTPSLSFTPFGQSPIGVSLSTASPEGTSWQSVLLISSQTGDGSAFFVYSATDALGNAGGLLQGATYFVIDTSAPLAPASLSATPQPGALVALAWPAPSGEPPFRYEVFRDSVSISTVAPNPQNFSGSYSDSPLEGNYLYEVASLDLAGNTSPRVSTSAAADMGPPPAPVNLQAALNGDQIDLSWSPGAGESASGFRLYRATNPISGLSGLFFVSVSTTNHTDVPTEDGTYYYVVTALDLALNESGLSNGTTVVFDRAAPVIAISIADGAYFNTDVSPAFSATDTNLDTVTATLNGQPFNSGSLVSPGGDYDLAVTASDMGGHISTRTVHFTIDKTAPQIFVSGVAQGAVYNNSVTANISIADANPDGFAATLNGQAYQSGTLITQDASYTLSVQATDKAGNTAQKNVSFALNAAPLAPSNFMVVAEAGLGASLSWQSSETDLLGFRVYRNGVKISGGLSPQTQFLDSGFQSGTSHFYQVEAVDSLSQVGPRAAATVKAMKLDLTGLGL